jgi:hypothetical protein
LCLSVATPDATVLLRAPVATPTASVLPSFSIATSATLLLLVVLHALRPAVRAALLRAGVRAQQKADGHGCRAGED